MIRIENVVTPSGDQWEAAIRGMRNPLESWHKSDSEWDVANWCEADFRVGEDDLGLMHRLYVGGSEHRKFARQLPIIMDITTHHVFWAELDTYKIGTTRNSCSKMHRIHVHPFNSSDFSHDGIDMVGGFAEEHFDQTLLVLEELRIKFNETREKHYWRALLELLPMGFNIRATVSMNYETAINIIRQRKGHKVWEWEILVACLEHLPHMREIMYGLDEVE